MRITRLSLVPIGQQRDFGADLGDRYKLATISLDGVKAIGAEARDKGFSALKTNIFICDNGAASRAIS